MEQVEGFLCCGSVHSKAEKPDGQMYLVYVVIFTAAWMHVLSGPCVCMYCKNIQSAQSSGTDSVTGMIFFFIFYFFFLVHHFFLANLIQRNCFTMWALHLDHLFLLALSLKICLTHLMLSRIFLHTYKTAWKWFSWKVYVVQLESLPGKRWWLFPGAPMSQVTR